MKAANVEQIAEAILYEGYALYPYRPTSTKNVRERFTFGRVYPEPYSAAQHGAEPFVMQTECLVKATNQSSIQIKTRFLQPVARKIGAFESPFSSLPDGTEPPLRFVTELRAGSELFQAWHEAVEREVAALAVSLAGDSAFETECEFEFQPVLSRQPICNGNLTVGVICRSQAALKGKLEIHVETVHPLTRKITLRILNLTPMEEPDLKDAEAVLLRTMASTHSILTIAGGEFVSLMDPPLELKEAASCCRNTGTWPVLVGDENSQQRDTMLSSPIILYDYPKLAPESAGPLFDGLEIDEILTLRIQTMTEQEKLEMRSVDERTRRLLEQTEALPQEALLRMHGTKREPPPLAPIEFDDFFGANIRLTGVMVKGSYLQAGDRVRVCPKSRADVMDMALSGQTAVIEAVEQDLEKRIHLALVLENDPGKDLGLLRQTGHRFFFGVDEVEPLKKEAG